MIKLLKGFINQFKKDKPAEKGKIKPIIIPRGEHSISRSRIHPNALKVLYRLHQAGYSAYLVGGCVRDLLLGFKPKDFDIATDALPEEVRKLFRNCRLIGKRFRLAHILFGREIIEVATFRTHHEQGKEKHGKMHQGMIVRDNVFGTIEDDAWRRDFRINALYYNIADFSIIDYTGGMHDIKDHILHMIGEPEQRFHEDPVRILRAVRFIAKLNVKITPETEEPLTRLSYLISHVSSGRLYQEILKIFQEGATLSTFQLMQKYNIFHQLFPETAALIIEKPESLALLNSALTNTDQRVLEGKTVSPAFLFAIFLWNPIQEKMQEMQRNRVPTYAAYEKASYQIIKNLTQILAIPRVMQMTIREVCLLQHRFMQRRGTQPIRLVEHPRFRAAYDLLLLRVTAGEPMQELASWWTQFYNATQEDREKMIQETQNLKSPRRVHRKKFKKNPNQSLT